jgi:hypothetical protein
VLSAVTLIVVAYLELKVVTVGIIILLIVVSLIYLCNFVNVLLVFKVLQIDTKFQVNYRKRIFANTVIRALSTLTYYKLHEIVFSNMFRMRAFSNKVDSVTKLRPFNILLLISFIFSFVEVIGAATLLSHTHPSRLASPTFIQSLDCIIAVALNAVPTALVLRRHPDDYEHEIIKKPTNNMENNHRSDGKKDQGNRAELGVGGQWEEFWNGQQRST